MNLVPQMDRSPIWAYLLVIWMASELWQSWGKGWLVQVPLFTYDILGSWNTFLPKLFSMLSPCSKDLLNIYRGIQIYKDSSLFHWFHGNEVMISPPNSDLHLCKAVVTNTTSYWWSLFIDECRSWYWLKFVIKLSISS